MTDEGSNNDDGHEAPQKKTVVSRRRMLGGLAVGAAALGVPTVAAAQAGGRGRGRRQDNDGSGRDGTGDNGGDGNGDRGDGQGQNRDRGDDGPARFSRMFESESFSEADDELRIQLAALGAPGGILDANDPLEEGPIRLITELELSANNPNNTFQTAGSTFVGQFLDHDITSDAGSTLGRPVPLRRSTNLRSARLDLDSVYGGGPQVSPELYESADRTLFRVENGGQFEDLPRDGSGQAIIADPRNDENLIIAGLQVSFLKFHNAIVEQTRTTTDLDDAALFAEARRIVVWHYQWLVLHQFLPQFVGSTMVNDILSGGRRYYTTNTPTIPVEFQTSAFRFGHSLIRPSYRANLAGDNGEAFFGMVFDPSQFGVPDPDDMSGGHRAARRFIGWQTFFDFEDGEVKPNKTIDTRMSTPLFQLPLGTIATNRGEPIGPTSLATRNLLRHITWQVASGENVAQEMGETPLSEADFSDITAIAPRLAGATPLWLYILREAALMHDGRHLGTVGGRIVGEVFIGLLEMDPTSILNAGSGWRPSLPSRRGTGEFAMADLLTVAGVDPETRGQ